MEQKVKFQWSYIVTWNFQLIFLLILIHGVMWKRKVHWSTPWRTRNYNKSEYLKVLREDETYAADALIDLAPAPPLPDKNDLDGPGGPGAGGGASGGGGFQYPPQNQHQPPYYQPPQHMGNLMYPGQGGGMAYPPPINASSMNG